MMKTDAQIQKDVTEELEWEPAVDATAIGVMVSNGVVTLAGHVNSFAEKWDAERAALRVYGVKAIAVEMDVKLNGSSERLDGDIARTAENVIEWASYLQKNSVKAMVENGWITLTGEVDWAYQRFAAAAAVRYLMGVKGVSNEISLKPKLSVDVIKADIESALKRSAKSDARQISVSVHGGVITLGGDVNSWAERDTAHNIAWSSPGVKNVIDKINVTY